MVEAPRRGRPRNTVAPVEHPDRPYQPQTVDGPGMMAKLEQDTQKSLDDMHAASKPERRRRPSTGGHEYKLSAPQREGETRRFVNDEGNRIAQLQELGYEFVSDTSVKTDQPGSRIARRVGTQANGAPLHAYLMETPDQLYQQGVDEKEQKNALVDQAIEAGRDFTGRLKSEDNQYGHGLIEVKR